MFNPGDFIECLDDYNPGDEFTKGGIYTVKEVIGARVKVVADDSGQENSWNLAKFNLVVFSDGAFTIQLPTGYGEELARFWENQNTTKEASKCECGAHATTWPDDHMSFCPMLSTDKTKA